MIEITTEEQKERFLIASVQLKEEYATLDWHQSVRNNRNQIFQEVDGVYEYRTCLAAIRGSYFYGIAEYVENGLCYRFKQGRLISNYKVQFL